MGVPQIIHVIFVCSIINIQLLGHPIYGTPHILYYMDMFRSWPKAYTFILIQSSRQASSEPWSDQLGFWAQLGDIHWLSFCMHF